MYGIGVVYQSSEPSGLIKFAARVSDTNVTGLLMQLRLSLTELDRRFAYMSEGRPYHGEAINPKGLSLWERMTGFSKVGLQLVTPNSYVAPHLLIECTHCRDRPAVGQSRCSVLGLPRGSCSKKATPFPSNRFHEGEIEALCTFPVFCKCA